MVSEKHDFSESESGSKGFSSISYPYCVCLSLTLSSWNTFSMSTAHSDAASSPHTSVTVGDSFFVVAVAGGADDSKADAGTLDHRPNLRQQPYDPMVYE